MAASRGPVTAEMIFDEIGVIRSLLQDNKSINVLEKYTVFFKSIRERKAEVQKFLSDSPHVLPLAYEIFIEEILAWPEQNPDQDYYKFDYHVNWKNLIRGNLIFIVSMEAFRINHSKLICIEHQYESNVRILRKIISQQQELQKNAVIKDDPLFELELLNLAILALNGLLEQRRIYDLEQPAEAKQTLNEEAGDAAPVADAKQAIAVAPLSEDWQCFQRAMQITYQLLPYPREPQLTSFEEKNDYFERINYRYGKPGEYCQPDILTGLHDFFNASNTILLARLLFLVGVVEKIERPDLTFQLKSLTENQGKQRTYTVRQALEELVKVTASSKKEVSQYIHYAAEVELKNLGSPQAKLDNKQQDSSFEKCSTHEHFQELVENGQFQKAYTLYLARLEAEKTKDLRCQLHIANFYFLGLHNPFHHPNVAQAIYWYNVIMEQLSDNEFLQMQEIYHNRFKLLKMFATADELKAMAGYKSTVEWLERTANAPVPVKAITDEINAIVTASNDAAAKFRKFYIQVRQRKENFRLSLSLFSSSLSFTHKILLEEIIESPFDLSSQFVRRVDWLGLLTADSVVTFLLNMKIAPQATVVDIIPHHEGNLRILKKIIAQQTQLKTATTETEKAQFDPELLHLAEMVLNSLLEQQQLNELAQQQVTDVKGEAKTTVEKPVRIPLSENWQHFQRALQADHQLLPYPREPKLKLHENKDDYFQRINYRYGRPGEVCQPDIITKLHLLFKASHSILLARLFFLVDIVQRIKRPELTFEWISLESKSNQHEVKKYTVREALHELIQVTHASKREVYQFINRVAHREFENLFKASSKVSEDKANSVQGYELYTYDRFKQAVATLNFQRAYRLILSGLKTRLDMSVHIDLHVANFYFLGLHNSFHNPDIAQAINLYCALTSASFQGDALLPMREIYHQRLQLLEIFATREELACIQSYRERIEIQQQHQDESALIREMKANKVESWFQLMTFYRRLAEEAIAKVSHKFTPRKPDEDAMVHEKRLIAETKDHATPAVDLWKKAYGYGSNEAKAWLTRFAPYTLQAVENSAEWKTNAPWREFQLAVSKTEQQIALAVQQKDSQIREAFEKRVQKPVLIDGAVDAKLQPFEQAKERYLLNLITRALIDIYGKEKSLIASRITLAKALKFTNPETVFPTNQAFATYLSTCLAEFNKPPKPKLNPHHMHAGAAAAAAPAASAVPAVAAPAIGKRL